VALNIGAQIVYALLITGLFIHVKEFSRASLTGQS
jgi:hypothetical protein